MHFDQEVQRIGVQPYAAEQLLGIGNRLFVHIKMGAHGGNVRLDIAALIDLIETLQGEFP